ncbi:Siderophore synthetase component [Quadrisphaera granulorum]|uniref:Siderophore synthetase component n=1 Tax=Quadrisphaera granulorum TaxID=317664 RepID=A0A316A8W1_9ACTN|nr:IucA/IucC family protein [Quadrisphaera granulorum]PWJ53648.1 siderophore synthetase component [Quadrisphaera granulorum]SZE96692.1 Siderophore synthetase component [Quadrisphaera granulorum]
MNSADLIADPTAHLSPQVWERADRALVAKAIGEYAHELLISPEHLGDDEYRLVTAAAVYSFTARRLPLDHWEVDPASVEVQRSGGAGAGVPARPRATQLVLDLRDELGLTDAVLPLYLEEVAATTAARAWTLHRGGPTSEELLEAGFQEVEAAMTAGHPVFVAGSGRIGFDADDLRRYAPESGATFRMEWVAVRRDRCVLALGEGLEEESLYSSELDAPVRERFREVLRGHGLDPADYLPVPVHPWQWRRRVMTTFAPELADRTLVHLGTDGDARRAQQSVRTAFNASHPRRSYVKTALSVLNMGFLRGLSTEYMSVTPAINDWVHDVVSSDPVLLERGFRVLRERAAVGYRPPLYEQAAPKGSPYRKMLAALWRESPVPLVEPGQKLVTMASLLHRDDDGRSFAAALVRASGLAPRNWLRRYLEAYLVPVLRCYYAHDLVFMPHGENLILVLEDHAVVSTFMKDIGEEVALLDTAAPLPADVERIRADIPEHLRLLSVQTDVFDCFFRQLSALLDGAGVLVADDFWDEVAACVLDHQGAHPEDAAAHVRGDLFTPTFARSCLNRLQLRDNQQMVDIADPATAIRIVGELENPLAAAAPARGAAEGSLVSSA